jgi:ectoine hydroxylase-related dioxygenase (phytanoyl-CoA dioxygenase family)
MAESRFPLLSFDDFHRELPDRLAAGNGAAARAASPDERAVALRVPGSEGYTYRPVARSIEVVAGTAPATTVIELSAEVWSDYAHELRTGFGLLYAGLAHCSTGRLDDMIAWDPAIRAMYSGRPVYDPATLDLVDRDGSPLELTRSFTLDSDPVEMRHFLRTAGFIHVRGVFGRGTVAAFSEEVERLRGLARTGDDRSWWATTVDRTDVCCRLTYVNERSEILARAHEDDRLAALVGAVTGDDLCMAVNDRRGDGHSVVIKHPGVAEGLSDLPWHVDCGLGGHPIMCPGLNVGVQLDAATAETGQLHFLAGSNGRTAVHLSASELAGDAYPTVTVTTGPGDVTMHLTDTLHAAPPPTGAGGRRALYLTWSNPLVTEFIAPGEGYNDVVLRSGPGNRVRSVEDQLAAT